jgi:hypothetical protein
VPYQSTKYSFYIEYDNLDKINIFFILYNN